MKRMGTFALVVSSVALAGCSSGSHQANSTTTSPSTSGATTSTQPDAQALDRAARAALDANHKVSIFVLWHNRVPAWASRSTGGPALASLRSAAVTRRSRGVRARLLSDRRRVVSLKLDPSYTSATAVVVDRQRVQPSGRNGKPLGRTVVLNERATYELRRIGSSGRFVVWRVVLSR
jgi:outer membrane murein-binding lipoprotein Lpp